MAIVVTALHIIKQNGHRHKRMINARLVAKVGCNIYQCFNLVRVFPVLVLFRSLSYLRLANEIVGVVVHVDRMARHLRVCSDSLKMLRSVVEGRQLLHISMLHSSLPFQI